MLKTEKLGTYFPCFFSLNLFYIRVMIQIKTELSCSLLHLELFELTVLEMNCDSLKFSGNPI